MEKLHFNRDETARTRKEEIKDEIYGDSLFSFFLSLSLAWLVSTLRLALRNIHTYIHTFYCVLK